MHWLEVATELRHLPCIFSMGSGMMVPVPFVLWMLGTAFFMFSLFLVIKAIAGGQAW